MKCRWAGGNRNTLTQPIYISPVNSIHTFTIFDQPYSFLVDTGAAATLLSAKTWDKVCQSVGSQQLSLAPAASQLVSVDSSPLTVKGTTTITLTCDQHKFSTSVIVVNNLAEEAILGLDFLESHHCTIDVLQRRLALRSNTAPVIIHAVPSQCRDVTLRAILCETVSIPPYSEMETLSSVDNFSHETGDWLVEDSLSTSKRVNATVARAIVTPSSQIVVRLVNPTCTPVTVYRGTRIASITRLPVVSLCGVSKITAVPSQHKKDLLWEIAFNTAALSDSEQGNSTLSSSHLLTSFQTVMMTQLLHNLATAKTYPSAQTARGSMTSTKYVGQEYYFQVSQPMVFTDYTCAEKGWVIAFLC